MLIIKKKLNFKALRTDSCSFCKEVFSTLKKLNIQTDTAHGNECGMCDFVATEDSNTDLPNVTSITSGRCAKFLRPV